MERGLLLTFFFSLCTSKIYVCAYFSVGWCMQNLLYFFLNRKWESDKLYMDDMLDYFQDLKYPLQLFVFPEGTNLCRSSIRNSDKFAEKNNLVKYKYCLHPRVTGFTYIVQKLRHDILDTVHDVTIGYPVNLCYGEIDVLKGKFPKEVHVHIKRYHMKQIPSDSEKVNEWCQDKFKEKEKRLEKFYENKHFENEPVLYKDQDTMKRSNTDMFSILFFWTLFLTIIIYAVYFYLTFRYYFYIMLAFYSILSVLGGTDKLQLDIHKKLYKKSKSN